MKGDAKVIEDLNKGLRSELTAINQYWLHYRLLNNWGLLDMAKVWRKESIEEMEHADKLIDRIIFLDGFPNMQVLDPLHIGQNVPEVLDCDLKEVKEFMGGKPHAGMNRTKGHFGFAGHGDAVAFRNVRIKDLSVKSSSEKSSSEKK